MDLRFSIVLLLTLLVISLFYRLQQRKEQQKIIALKDRFEKEEYATPLFNNAGFVVGVILLFGLGLLSAILKINNPDYGIPLIVGICLALFGLFMVYETTYVKLESGRIEFQSLLFKLLGVNLSKKVALNDITQCTKQEGMPGSPFIVLIIHTKDGKKFKLNTAFYNSEIGNALYEFLGKTTKM